jgi:predicted transcriptional regulator of viral defense system
LRITLRAAVASLRQVPARTIEGTDIRFVKLARRKFFGFAKYDVYGRQATISTPAKTVVDCVDRHDLAGGPAEIARIVHGAATELDPGELTEAALRMESKALLQRLGFLADLVGWKLPNEVRSKLRSEIPKSARSILGRAEHREHDIGYVAEWGLFVNVARGDILADVPRVERGLVS